MPKNQQKEFTLKKRAREITTATGPGCQHVLNLLRAGDTWRDRLAAPNPGKRDVAFAARIAAARAFNGPGRRPMRGRCHGRRTVGTDAGGGGPSRA